MPVEFLGDAASKAKKTKSSEDIEMHIPEKERIKRQQEVKVKEQTGEITIEDLNLAGAFKYYFLKRKLTFIILFVIIIIAGVYGYFRFFYKPTPVVVINQNENINLAPPPEPPIEPEQPIEPEPEPEPEPEVASLPDTELAPLRGSVINFRDAQALFLVEDNGELRYIDRRSVVFDNGQSINDLNPALIYTIADKYKTIRKGRDVVGLVDWDPRVLSPSELEPFINN